MLVTSTLSLIRKLKKPRRLETNSIRLCSRSLNRWELGSDHRPHCKSPDKESVSSNQKNPYNNCMAAALRQMTWIVDLSNSSRTTCTRRQETSCNRSMKRWMRHPSDGLTVLHTSRRDLLAIATNHVRSGRVWRRIVPKTSTICSSVMSNIEKQSKNALNDWKVNADLPIPRTTWSDVRLKRFKRKLFKTN